MRLRGRPSCAWADGAAVGLAVLACTTPVHAQFSGVAGIDSENRYRGLGTDDTGAVLRLSGMVDLPFGIYAGLSGLWRTHDGAFADGDAIAGASGRWSELEAFESVDAAWGWDAGAHRRFYGENSAYDFNELMAGLLGPGFNARLWWSPHYYGQSYQSWYGEINAWRELGEHWRVFAHVGWLRYGDIGYWPAWSPKPEARADGLVGLSWVQGPWELRVARDGLIAGEPPPGLDERMRAPAWILTANFAF